ncbi:MAG: hypothetical protein IJQ02_09725 [Oscillospiraceae bacterium]|nr:hypothetical protein [Oscillospiraceae bacterium]
MKRTAFLFLLICILLLAACGSANTGVIESEEPAAAETSEPIPTPTPVPELTFPDGSVHSAEETTLDLTALTHADVAETAALLAQMPELKEIDLGSDGAWVEKEEEREELNAITSQVERPETAARDLTWDDLLQLQEAAPDAELLYRFVFYGRYLTTWDEEMDLNHSVMTDEGAAVRKILPLMKRCTLLDMDSCGVSNESMAEIRDAWPEMNVVWRIWFANGYFTVRTDIEMLWCANFYPFMTSEFTQDLKYCTKLKYLDLGHCLELHDWDFIRYMPDLEVLIITASGWENLDMLENCTKLEFLEVPPMSHTYVDLRPLEKLTNLEYLNICGIGQSDGWEVLLNMTKLKRLWIGLWTAQSFPEGAIEQIYAALPDTEINVTEQMAAVGSWRVNPDGSVPERYLLLREQFDYDHWQDHAPYAYNDPLYKAPWERRS